MFDEGAQERIDSLNAATVVAGGLGERWKITEAGVGQGVGFQVRPEVFGGIEFRCVGREEHRVKAGCSRKEALRDSCSVSVKSIPQQNDAAGDLPQQEAEERDHFGAVDIGRRVESKVQVQSLAVGGHAQGRNHGDFLMVADAVAQNRGLPTRTPRAAQDGRHQNAALIQEDEMRIQAMAFFLARCQSAWIQF